MTDKKEPWYLGEGSYVLNEDADTDTLLHDAAEWMAHAWYLADEVSRRVAQMNNLPDKREITNKLSTMHVFTRMGVQCMRLIRRRLRNSAQQD